MNNIERIIPTKETIAIGPMEQNEAICLITNGIISKISQEDLISLNELAQDIHLWPLLLSLVRGQLSHYLKQYQLSFCGAIRDVKAKLHDNGLTAFDINNIESVKMSRRLAVKACIETTLKLLTKSLSDKIKMLLLWTGIGTALQTAVLNNLWNISKQDAETAIDTLWNYGLVQFTNAKMYLNSIAHRCAEVHVVISQYIIDSIESKEVDALSPFVGSGHMSVRQGLMLLCKQSFRVHNVPPSQIKEYYLKNMLDQIQNLSLPYFLKLINMHVITNPHMIKLTLERIRECLMNSSYTLQLHMLSLGEKFNILITECKEILKSAHKVCRKLNQDVHKHLVGNNYVDLI